MEETTTPTETTQTTEQLEMPVAQEANTVDRDLLEKFKQDNIKAKKRLQELEAQLEVERRNKLKEKEDWKTYAETLEKELESTRTERQALSQAMIYDKKVEAIRIAALNAGIRKDAIKHLEKFGTEGVDIETTSTGRINILGAEQFVARLKAEAPYLFDVKGTKVNAESPSMVGKTEITIEKLNELRDHWKKTGDSAPYQAALLEFRNKAN